LAFEQRLLCSDGPAVPHHPYEAGHQKNKHPAIWRHHTIKLLFLFLLHLLQTCFQLAWRKNG